MHPSALSRRQFLKLATLGAASALLSACQEKTNLPPPSPAGPSPTPRPTEPPAATTSTVLAQPTLNPAPPLQMLENSVFASGAFMLTPFKGGGVTILHNLDSFLNNCGFGCGLNGWTPYDALEDQNSWSELDLLAFEGRLPGSETWLRQCIRLQDQALNFEVLLDGPLDPDKWGWASFTFFLPISYFSGFSYSANDRPGIYPPEFGGKTDILGGIQRFEVCPQDPAHSFQILCAENPATLQDARAWNDLVYQLSISIPWDTGRLHFTLRPPVVDPGPNSPAIRWCQAGYPSQGSKYAILEIDWRDQFPDRSILLEDEDGHVVASGEFSLALMEYWKLIAKFDFSQVEKPGRYRLIWSGGQSSWFPIGAQVFKDYWQLTLDHFIPFEMCHIAIDLGDGLRAHAACHLDDAVQALPDKVGPDGYIAYEEDTSPGAGNPIPLAVGGWHDAGDYDLNMPAQAFVTHKLALAWEEFAPQRDVNSLNKEARRFSFDQPNGPPDLLEQVEWGARWLLSMQQADGRAYVGVIEPLGVWGKNELPETMTDGKSGTGDEREVYTNLHSEMQLHLVTATAAASRALQGYDDSLAMACRQAARKGWEYFQTHPEVYRPTVYSGGSEMTGREQMIMAAAAELYLTDPQTDYLEAIAQFETYLKNWPMSWPAPTTTNCGGFWYAAPFLARLLPRLEEGRLKESVLAALHKAIQMTDLRLSKTPFQADWWDFNEWGNNGFFLATLFDSYWLSKALPDQIAFHEALPSAYWLFGLHPLNDFTFLFGTGLPQPRYLYSGPLLKRFGSQPASIPGAVVPGISRYDPSRILAYRDIPGEYRNGEACIYDAAVAVFVLLALESLV